MYEVYTMGALAAWILDYYVDRHIWQSRLNNDNSILSHPMNLLLEHFSEYKLPAPILPTKQDIQRVKNDIKYVYSDEYIQVREFLVFLQVFLNDEELKIDDITIWIDTNEINESNLENNGENLVNYLNYMMSNILGYEIEFYFALEREEGARLRFSEVFKIIDILFLN